MKLNRLLPAALGAAVISASAGTAIAQPDESQRLRGMEGRSFAVTVTVVDTPIEFLNCYTFAAEGKWIDEAAAPVSGAWSQDGVGAATTYTANIGEAVVQTGMVTPARGSGTLQLDATTETAPGVLFPGAPALTLRSVGYEVDSCS